MAAHFRMKTFFLKLYVISVLQHRQNRCVGGWAAKAQLFTIFEALKSNDPVVLNGRRKLSSMIFA